MLRVLQFSRPFQGSLKIEKMRPSDFMRFQNKQYPNKFVEIPTVNFQGCLKLEWSLKSWIITVVFFLSHTPSSSIYSLSLSLYFYLSHAQKHAHRHSHTHTQTHKHTNTHTYTYTLTHTHIHSFHFSEC